MDPFPDIPVINYHKISDRADVGITSRKPDDFYHDLLLFHQLGFRTVTFKDVALGKPLPEKPLILTFDDGYRSVLENAYPAMQSFGFTGVIFIPTAYMGKNNDWDVQFGGNRFKHLGEDDLRLLNRAGFEIGSHGHRHRALTALAPKQAEEELRVSKERLETVLGEKVYSVSYPFGRFNRALLQAAQNCGYRFGVVSVLLRAPFWENGLGRLAVRRLNIYRMDSSKAIEQKLKKGFRCTLAYRDWLIQKGSSATILWQKWFRKS